MNCLPLFAKNIEFLCINENYHLESLNDIVVELNTLNVEFLTRKAYIYLPI